MFSTLSSLTTRSVFTFAIALLSISACGSKESKKESQEKFKEESKDVLSDTKWEQCAWSGETTVNGKLSKLYALHAWNFQKDGSFKNVLEFYASDEECKTKVSFDEVKKTFDWDLSKPGFTSLGTYKIAQLGANTDLYAIDLLLEAPEKFDFYTTLRLRDNTIEMSERCANEDYVKEGLCEKVDGFSPESRSNYLDRPIFENYKYKRVEL